MAISKIQSQVSECSKTLPTSCFIYLNGFIHTDDRLALLSMGKQMNLLNDDPDAASSLPKSFSDCLQWFLKMTKKIGMEEQNTDDKEENQKSPSKYLPLIFILEEFDCFAMHPKQTLLYNLLDLVQSKIRPVGVIGITSQWVSSSP